MNRSVDRRLFVLSVALVVAAGSAAPWARPAAASGPRGAATDLIGQVAYAGRSGHSSVRGTGLAHEPRLKAAVSRPFTVPRTATPAVSASAVVVTPPAPVVATFSTDPPSLRSVGFDGMSATTLPCYGTPCREPARSGIAVGPFDVVQATSVGLRLTDRAGNAPFDVTYGDYFNLPTTGFAADGRIAWDAKHKRWLATWVETSCDGGAGPQAWLDVAVSESTDPEWRWTWYGIPFGTVLPVRPAIGTSADKIVVGIGIGQQPVGIAGFGCGFFDSTYPSTNATELVVVDWATLLGFPTSLPYFTSVPEADATPWRPALADPAQPATTDVSAIDFGPPSGSPARLATVTGTVAGGISVAVTDLTAAGVLSSMPAPTAPTDLVRRGSDLWTVWDDACQSVSGPYGCVRVAEITTNGSSQVEDVLIGTPGHNAYAGGITVAGDGTLHVLYSLEPISGSAFQQVSTWHVEQPAAAAAGAFSQPALIAAGAYVYSGTYPGGFVGLAPDPSDPHAVWQAGEYAGDPDGTWTTWISQVTSGVAATPAGPFSIEAGRLTTHALRIHLSAAATSGTQLLLSNVGTTAGGILSKAIQTQPSDDITWSLSDASTGGTTATGTRTVYLQWGDGAGGWQPVTSAKIKYAGSPPVVRLAGADRYATAAAIVTSQYAPGVGAVYIATGLNFPDALAGAAAAGHLGDPLLLVTATTIPAPTAAALTYLKPASIIVLGGAGVVSDGVRSALAAFTTAGAAGVSRISGTNRYATAAAVSAATYAPGVEMVLIATGLNFPDALTGAAVAGHYGAPLLLVSATGIPAETATELSRLKPHRIVILGGTGAVSAAIGTSLHAYTDGGVFRVSGSTRYDTAANIAMTFFAPGPTLADVATGLNFPDALAGAPLAGRLNSPVVLVSATAIPSGTATALGYLAVPEIDVLGGPGVIGAPVITSLAAYIVP